MPINTPQYPGRSPQPPQGPPPGFMPAQPRPSGPPPSQVQAPATPAPSPAANPPQLRTSARSVGRFPVVNLILLETGLALGLILFAINESLLYVAIGCLAITVVLGLVRWRGQWFTHWISLTIRYASRKHDRVSAPTPPTSLESIAEDERPIIGGDDARINLLRLLVPDLVVAHGNDHERHDVGISWHQGTWTAVLLIEPTPALISHAGGTPNLPLSALAPCLEDRGVILDAIRVIWHCYPGSAALPSDSPALRSYLEVLGPLPAAARRTTWVTIRLDPRRCAAAIQERGGGVIGAHRALIGALSRVRNALESRGVPTRPLNPDELLRAGISAAELTAVAGSSTRVGLQESWAGVTAAGIGHRSYAINKWSSGKIVSNLNTLTSVRALSATVALTISPAEEQKVGLRGLFRLSARNPDELYAAEKRILNTSQRLGIELSPLHGLQVDGLSATLPLGGGI